MAGTTKRALLMGAFYGLLMSALTFLFLSFIPRGGLSLWYPALWSVLLGVLGGLVFGVLIAAYLRRREARTSRPAGAPR